MRGDIPNSLSKRGLHTRFPKSFHCVYCFLALLSCRESQDSGLESVQGSPLWLHVVNGMVRSCVGNLWKHSQKRFRSSEGMFGSQTEHLQHFCNTASMRSGHAALLAYEFGKLPPPARITDAIVKSMVLSLAEDSGLNCPGEPPPS